MADDNEFLRADFEHLTASLIQNEELGEKRVTSFVTLGSAFFAAVGFIGEKNPLPGVTARAAAIFLGTVLLAIGVLTLLRIMRRNAATNSFIAPINVIRERQAPTASSVYRKHLKKGPRSILNGGHAYVVAVMNTGLVVVLSWAVMTDPVSPVALAGLATLALVVQFALIAEKSEHPGAEVTDEKFRAGVGLLVLNATGLVLAIERTGNPGSWQLPQGGLHEGEKPIDGALRELNEETGLEPPHVTLLAEHPEWLAYELPAQYRSKKTGLGQVQKWFLFRFEGTDADIQLPSDGEARAWAWRDPGELASSSTEFRQPTYRRLVGWLGEQERKA